MRGLCILHFLGLSPLCGLLRYRYSCIPLMVIKVKLIFKVTSCCVPAQMLGNYGNLILRQKATTTKVGVTLFRNFRGNILEAMWVEKHRGGRGDSSPWARVTGRLGAGGLPPPFTFCRLACRQAWCGRSPAREWGSPPGNLASSPPGRCPSVSP